MFKHRFASRRRGGFSKNEEQAIAAFYIRHFLECSNTELSKEFLDLFCACHPNGPAILAKCAIDMKLTTPSPAEAQQSQIRKYLREQEKSFPMWIQEDDDDLQRFVLKRLDRLPDAADGFKSALLKALTSEDFPQELPARYGEARTLIHKLFTINDQEINLCEFLAALNESSIMDDFFNDELHIRCFYGRHVLQQMLSLNDQTELCRMLKHLQESALIRVDDDDGEIHLSGVLQQFWRTPDVKELEKQFLGQATGQIHPLEQYRLPQEDVDHISQLLLSYSVDDANQAPVNILLYGAPGTGKSTFAVSLLKHLGIRPIVPTDPEDRNDRRTQLVASSSLAHAIASRGEKVVLLVDEADGLLSTSGLAEDFFSILGKHFPSGEKRSWVHLFLEHTQETQRST